MERHRGNSRKPKNASFSLMERIAYMQWYESLGATATANVCICLQPATFKATVSQRSNLMFIQFSVEQASDCVNEQIGSCINVFPPHAFVFLAVSLELVMMWQRRRSRGTWRSCSSSRRSSRSSRSRGCIVSQSQPTLAMTENY
jgi:hypothetical protein